MTSPAGTVNYTYWIDGALKTREVLNTSGNPVTYSNYEYNPAGMLKKLENKTSAKGSQRSLYDMNGSGADTSPLQRMEAMIQGWPRDVWLGVLPCGTPSRHGRT